ncbi:recombination-associated protein RdgC [Phytohalomonas tamaricis]|uniref:recombination-associated protein RdgC n=1 Tax=Phytohalomonas tamaricis TaxID=2081032 RepID=UPI000D0AFCB8|nr:recombination-associated protein RdgC [Phytohalomonas tamaricis]
MWFKHLHLYRLHDNSPGTPEALEEALAAYAFRPVNALEAKRSGWTAPAGRGSNRLVHEIQGHRLITLCRQERLLPNSVVKEVLEERAAEREAEQGYPPRRREKQALKEQIIEELLPQAFTRTTRVDLWWDTSRRLIGVHCASRKRAEDVLDLLRQSLGSLKVTPLAVAIPPVRTMTNWLHDATARPDTLLLGDQVELRAGKGDEGVLRARQVDLDSDEILAALTAGRQASRLALTLEEQVSLVLHEDLTLKSLRFADAIIDEAQDSDDDGDPILRMETEFALMTHVLSNAIEQLIDWLGGEADFTPATS